MRVDIATLDRDIEKLKERIYTLEKFLNFNKMFNIEYKVFEKFDSDKEIIEEIKLNFIELQKLEKQRDCLNRLNK